MGRKKKILFVEPDREFRREIKKMLEQSGYGVLIAAEGQDALDILSRESVDLVLSALKTPDVNGIELMGEINRKKMGVPAIFLAVYGDVESYMDLMNMGAFDYINLPVDDNEMLRVIRSAVGDQGDSVHAQSYSILKAAAH